MLVVGSVKEKHWRFRSSYIFHVCHKSLSNKYKSNGSFPDRKYPAKRSNLIIVYLENAWNSKQMITEGEFAILQETTRRAFGNQSQSKQR